MKKRVVIYGAGKIGRGYAANLFRESGYELLFVTHQKSKADLLNSRQQYKLLIAAPEEPLQERIITNYKAISADDPNLIPILSEIGLIALTVYADAFPSVGERLADLICRKYSQQDSRPLNLIIFANILTPKKILKKEIYHHLPEKCRAFADSVLGLADTIIDTTSVLPDSSVLAEDPLAVLIDSTDGLPVESSLKGEAPQIQGFQYCDSLEIPAMRKLYTANMMHAGAAYLGYAKSCAVISDALKDPEILQIIEGALEEINLAFEKEYHFTPEESRQNTERVIKKFGNPAIIDTPIRVGSNPIRKLGYSERLIGAALLARRNGIYPYYILKIAAYALQFSPKEDPCAQEMRTYIMENGLDKAIRKYTGLHEADVIYTLKRHYQKADGKFTAEDPDRIRLLKKTYTCGFLSEKEYRGCAQGTLITLSKITGIENKDLFRAATGFSGGMSLCGDGVCGGYSGGLLFMSYLKGRDLDRIPIDGDKENQYAAYACAQALHDHFIACYGSPVCMQIHKEMFQGEHFILRTKARRNEFEEAGAHTVVCTTVVAMASVWVMEILLDNNLYIPD